MKNASPFLDSKQICLVGVKKQPNSTTVEYITKDPNNINIAAKTANAAAPDTSHLTMPKGKIIELFFQETPPENRVVWIEQLKTKFCK